MRSTIFVFGALGSLAILVAACSGSGGGSTTPAAVSPTGAASPLAAASIDPTTAQVVNFTGPGTKVTVSVQIPRRTGTQGVITQAAYHKLYPSRLADKNIRTMAQTAPTAKIRAAGAAQNAYRARIEQSQTRKPEYVSPTTYYMEFVISSGSTIEVDEVTTCSISSSTCSGSFDAPIGTGLTATLFLYDDCAFLLSAGSLANQSIIPGQTNNLSITLNGVVDHFAMTTNPTQSPYTGGGTQYPPLSLYQGGSFPQNFSIELTPYDADENTISSPGVLIDDNFFKIGSVGVSTPPEAGLTLTSSSSVIVPANPANMSATPITYTWDGSGPSGSLTFVGTPVETGSPVVPAAVTSGACGGYPNACSHIQYGSESSALLLYVVQPAMSWTNPNGIYPGGSPPGSWYGGATWHLELGAPPITPPVIYQLGVEENIPYSSNTITFTDVGGNCASTGIVNPLPTPIAAFTWPQTDVNLSIAATSAGQCELEATDLSSNATYLTISVNDPSITVYGKGRK